MALLSYSFIFAVWTVAVAPAFLVAILAKYAGRFPVLPLFGVDASAGGRSAAATKHFADGVFDQIHRK